MIGELIGLENIPHIKQAELERRMEAVMGLIDEGRSPVVIHSDNGYRLLMFGWDDFFQRFGWLYSNEEKAAIEAACKEYEEKCL